MADTGTTRVLTGDTVVLPPRGRRLKWGTRALLAIVRLDECVVGGWDRYRHPTVTIGPADDEGGHYYRDRAEIRFQSNIPDGQFDRPGSRGFLSVARGTWTYSYGGTFECDCGRYDGRSLARLTALVKRAMDRAPRGCKGDALLELIAGLQRCGVEVRIHSGGVRRAREARVLLARSEECAA